VVQILIVVLEGIGTALTGRCRIRGIMIEKWMSSECEDTAETTVSGLIEVEGTAEEVSHTIILDKVSTGEEKKSAH
jgi:hypothetical protein